MHKRVLTSNGSLLFQISMGLFWFWSKTPFTVFSHTVTWFYFILIQAHSPCCLSLYLDLLIFFFRFSATGHAQIVSARVKKEEMSDKGSWQRYQVSVFGYAGTEYIFCRNQCLLVLSWTQEHLNKCRIGLILETSQVPYKNFYIVCRVALAGQLTETESSC